MSTGGLPLLSGQPPDYMDRHEQSCRKCDKEFNILFARARRCNHCGYMYCHSCTDFQALMPRSGEESGYDVVPVCAFCIDKLTITAGGRNHLRSLPLARLKNYANAYNIKVNGVFEKDDLVDTLIAARDPNGCLPHANEDYYRKHSVPNRRSNRPRGIFTRAMDAMGSERSSNHPQQQPQAQPQYQPRQRTASGPSRFARPDLDPRPQQQQQQQQQQQRYQQQQPRSPPRAPPSGYTPPPAQPSGRYSNLNVPSSGGGPAPGRARAASAGPSARPTSPPQPVPTLDELLEMPEDQLAHLSIHVLNAVLFQNHVNARLVVEKEELVDKVRVLLADERRERERHAREEEEEREAEEAMRREAEETMRREMEEALRQSREDAEENERRTQESADDHDHGEDNRTMDHAHAEDRTMQVDDFGNVPGQSQEPPTHDLPPPPPPPKPAAPSPPPKSLSPKAQAMASRLERTGLCVICQDEEANIAIVDCGHLCLCRPCSELIMKSSRECPLCRTRIVTAQRLLRIFRT